MTGAVPTVEHHGPVAMARRRAGDLAAALPLWPTLVVVSVVVLVVQLPGPHATAWHFFEDAARLLVGDGPAGEAAGLRLYRDHPELQFGPLSIVAALPFVLLGSDLGSWTVMVVSSVAGLVALALVLDTVDRLRPGFRAAVDPRALLVGGVVVVVTWGDVAVRTAHIDDALALVAITAALRSCAHGRGWATTVALAVAAAAKPWAVMFAPLALIPPLLSPRARGAPALLGRALLRFGVVGALAALTWAPFVLAEPQTLDTSSYGITNDPTSVLRALGVDDPTTPLWVRPTQLVGGMVIVALLVARGRWPAALLAGVAWRVLLDPGAHRYYTVGFVLGALLVELLVRRGRVPWFSVAAAITLEATAFPGIPVVPGRILRLACVTGALVVVSVVRVTAAPGSRWRDGTGASVDRACSPPA